MKRLLYLVVIPLLLVGCNKNNNSSSQLSSSSSKEVDYGRVTFDNIYLYKDGYDVEAKMLEEDAREVLLFRKKSK